jgi:hypothetical protein
MALREGRSFAKAEWVPRIIILENILYRCTCVLLMPWPVFLLAVGL